MRILSKSRDRHRAAPCGRRHRRERKVRRARAPRPRRGGSPEGRRPDGGSARRAPGARRASHRGSAKQLRAGLGNRSALAASQVAAERHRARRRARVDPRQVDAAPKCRLVASVRPGDETMQTEKPFVRPLVARHAGGAVAEMNPVAGIRRLGRLRPGDRQRGQPLADDGHRALCFRSVHDAITASALSASAPDTRTQRFCAATTTPGKSEPQPAQVTSKGPPRRAPLLLWWPEHRRSLPPSSISFWTHWPSFCRWCG